MFVLSRLWLTYSSHTPHNFMEIMKNLILALLFIGFTASPVSAQLPEKAEDISPLLCGEAIPEASLVAVDGSSLSLMNLLAKKPTVLIFYRGGWCPYCNAHLAKIQGAEKDVLNLGYQIIAISPDSPENLKMVLENNKLGYTLLSDADGTLMKAVGLAFKAPERYSERLMKSSSGLNKGLLPVPSVFVLDTSGRIQFEYINPDYKTRLSAGLLVAVLKELKKEEM